MNTFYFLFILPGSIVVMIIYYLIKHVLHLKKNEEIDIVDELEKELQRIKEMD